MMSRKRRDGTRTSPCTTRRMTDEELRETEIQLQKEKARYTMNLQIGGIDERGNYTALHRRWEESKGR